VVEHVPPGRRPGSSTADAPEAVQRALCVAAGLGLLLLADGNFGVALGSPWRVQISPLRFLLALGLTAAACSVRTARAELGEAGGAGVAVAVTATEAIGSFLDRPGFGVDERVTVFRSLTR
jgi:hypothetical protein